MAGRDLQLLMSHARHTLTPVINTATNMPSCYKWENSMYMEAAVIETVFLQRHYLSAW